MSDSKEQGRDEIRGLVREALQRQIGGPSAETPKNAVASNIDTSPSSSPLIDESVKRVITEADVREIPAGARLLIRGDAIVTPAAQDLIRERAIEIRHHAHRSA